MNLLERVRHGIIVSCQALPDEPLHGSAMMAHMAKAAEQGGAVGIRANTGEDVRAIKRAVSLPVIGIVKREYEGSEVYITPTSNEVDELAEAGADMIAFDATRRKRPAGQTLESLIAYMRSRDILMMADVSTLEEAVYAEKLGVNCVSTTLSGYTSYSPTGGGPDFGLVEQAAKKLRLPLFAEGRIETPEQARQMLSLGAHCVVIGSAITRPQLITQRFAAAATKGSAQSHGHEVKN
ncbi:N-acetylmannosamine-6-phosphate 2-epimerase [Cohnella lubricantis]|uniref:Putative N-acetylmannosamine-6-phosphate 2-epimerase n=1 Tax=Cohnella lubricantis TaxID=2163172 RepID=A0A841THR0_9BACL|nr:N-acetylmannosamine-6-phosphate 2-epimerase [Cohnella lubricantis]MBB6678487.1 N-acetylmannosamine-6-phosphate 2-epimerase [Cohnella lubricantis]MBP2118410.1 N-acylglucosamine-6-phosphate 2-epimerase [Cohnella lubricantis]